MGAGKSNGAETLDQRRRRDGGLRSS
jgi:hypothetical protein